MPRKLPIALRLPRYVPGWFPTRSPGYVKRPLGPRDCLCLLRVPQYPLPVSPKPLSGYIFCLSCPRVVPTVLRVSHKYLRVALTYSRLHLSYPGSPGIAIALSGCPRNSPGKVLSPLRLLYPYLSPKYRARGRPSSRGLSRASAKRLCLRAVA